MWSNCDDNEISVYDENEKENNRLILSRHIEQCGIELFNAVKEKKLEGIVAKKKDSKYEVVGKRSRAWIKYKVLNGIDAVVCGYIRKKMESLVLLWVSIKELS
ncbi:MAG TPA: hypothetical protein DHW61_12755 [Lachnoclostridium phytofermentans]|uniref:ATP-dependent DNA ligase family profile domain-containing protein n=1 Tax=Lachnoclostridium phytofermentans TaxID=66219 RepID=A0A3D2X8E8_9FIRM|nr:hypothetical protein [Lachnoclostridium sp.]HCL03256.1 hypothetical protein [Lachnoclostridium phytofermentans]